MAALPPESDRHVVRCATFTDSTCPTCGCPAGAHTSTGVCLRCDVIARTGEARPFVAQLRPPIDPGRLARVAADYLSLTPARPVPSPGAGRTGALWPSPDWPPPPAPATPHGPENAPGRPIRSVLASFVVFPHGDAVGLECVDCLPTPPPTTALALLDVLDVAVEHVRHHHPERVPATGTVDS